MSFVTAETRTTGSANLEDCAANNLVPRAFSKLKHREPWVEVATQRLFSVFVIDVLLRLRYQRLALLHKNRAMTVNGRIG